MANSNPSTKPTPKGGGLAPKEQRANRLYLAHLDFEEALSYLAALSALEDLPVERRGASHDAMVDAVFIATVVVYARSFVESEAGGMAAPKLGASIFRGQPELRALHQQVLDMRQQAIAHADWRYHGVNLPEFAAGQVARHAWRPHYRHRLETWKLFELFTLANSAVVSQLIDLKVDVTQKPVLQRIQHHPGPVPATILALF